MEGYFYLYLGTAFALLQNTFVYIPYLSANVPTESLRLEKVYVRMRLSEKVERPNKERLPKHGPCKAQCIQAKSVSRNPYIKLTQSSAHW